MGVLGAAMLNRVLSRGSLGKVIVEQRPTGGKEVEEACRRGSWGKRLKTGVSLYI